MSALASTAVIVAVAIIAFAVTTPRGHDAAAPARGAVTPLPLAAEGPVSRTLGRDDHAYWAAPTVGGVAMRNPGQHLRAQFSATGVRVRSGALALAMALTGYGYGTATRTVGVVAPRAHANGVTYHRAGLVESYTNGPFGLEQSFVLPTPLAGRHAGPLTIALAWSGGVSASLSRGGEVRFAAAGGSLAYRGLFATDATGRRLPAWIQLHGHRLLLRVNDARARYPITVDPLVQQVKLTASDGAGSDFMGYSVAVSGNTLVAGAVGVGAYVFTKPAAAWSDATEAAKLTASDGAADDQLARSVAISGDTVFAGAPAATVDGKSGQGAAYVFTKPAAGWSDETEAAKLTASDGAANDWLGMSIATSGDTVVAGAQGATVDGKGGQGATYVFTKPAAGWSDETEAAKLTASDGAYGSWLGFGVAVSGETVVASAAVATVGSNGGQGAAYVFTKPAVGWSDETEAAKLTASDGAANDDLGISIATSGDTVVAGAPGATTVPPGAGGNGQGAAYVFTKPAAGWSDETEAAKLTGSDLRRGGEALGSSLALSGDTVVAGAPYARVGSNNEQGEAYVFTKPAAGWSDETEAAKLTASDGATEDAFGWSVALAGGTVFAGAPWATVSSKAAQGAVYVFGQADSTPPSITLTSPPDGASYTLGQSVVANYSCADESGGSGVASCAGAVDGTPVADGAALPTDTAGTHTFVVSAADNAGNTSSDTHTYTVLDVVTRDGRTLLLHGAPYRPIGLNIYNANSNGWCSYAMDGSVLDDSLTAIGAGKNAGRAWFFQQLATTNGARDWTAFDRTLASARAHGYKVVATLADQWGDCGVSTVPGYGYKDKNWYVSGYMQPDPSVPVSYRDWVQEVVSRYKDDPTILAWQLVNEPEVLNQNGGDCGAVPESTAETILTSFASDVSGLVKSIDTNHLVSLGTIGSGQCGAQNDDYTTVMSIPTLDLCEYHDYTPSQFVPGDQWNGLARRIQQCNELDKPLLVGELGVKPNDVGGTLTARADVVASKLCAQTRAGVAGILLWNWNKDRSLLDNFDIGPGDPVLDVLSPWSDPAHSCSAPRSPSGIVAAAGDGKAAVAWNPPSSDGGSPLTGYTVTVNPGGVSKQVGGGTTRTTVSGLANGTAYTFTVTATNAAGTSDPSAPSSAVTPRAGNPDPAAATGTASPTSSTTVSTGDDPAAIGGTTTSVTVPPGTSGGGVSVTQSATSETAPAGYTFGGGQVAIVAPSASAASPLRLVFTITPAPGQTPDSTEIFRTEPPGAPTLVGDCGGPAGNAVPDPCVGSRESVTIAGATYIRVTVLSSSASHWNFARPRAGAVLVSDRGYTPQTVMIQPGATLNWSFAGKKSHSVTDSGGLGSLGRPWFDSGAKTSGSYSFTFPAAGSFVYRSTGKGDSFAGTVSVPLLVTPATGRTTTTYSVIWSTRTIAGYVFDVQYRFRPAGSTRWGGWTSWKSGVTAPNGAFTPSRGAGNYAFHAQLRNASTGRKCGESPEGSIVVS